MIFNSHFSLKKFYKIIKKLPLSYLILLAYYFDEFTAVLGRVLGLLYFNLRFLVLLFYFVRILFF